MVGSTSPHSAFGAVARKAKVPTPKGGGKKHALHWWVPFDCVVFQCPSDVISTEPGGSRYGLS